MSLLLLLSIIWDLSSLAHWCVPILREQEITRDWNQWNAQTSKVNPKGLHFSTKGKFLSLTRWKILKRWWQKWSLKGLVYYKSNQTNWGFPGRFPVKVQMLSINYHFWINFIAKWENIFSFLFHIFLRVCMSSAMNLCIHISLYSLARLSDPFSKLGLVYLNKLSSKINVLMRTHT